MRKLRQRWTSSTLHCWGPYPCSRRMMLGPEERRATRRSPALVKERRRRGAACYAAVMPTTAATMAITANMRWRIPRTRIRPLSRNGFTHFWRSAGRHSVSTPRQINSAPRAANIVVKAPDWPCGESKAAHAASMMSTAPTAAGNAACVVRLTSNRLPIPTDYKRLGAAGAGSDAWDSRT